MSISNKPDKITAKRMSPTQFRAWMKRMDFDQTKAARALGVTRVSVRRWASPAGRGAPPHISLACEALESRR